MVVAGWRSSGVVPSLKLQPSGRPTWTSCLPKLSGKPTSWPSTSTRTTAAVPCYEWLVGCKRDSAIGSKWFWVIWLAQTILKLFDWFKIAFKLLIGSRAHGYKNCFFRVVKLVVFTAPFLHGSQITWNLNFLTQTCFGFHTGLELYFSFRTITFE